VALGALRRTPAQVADRGGGVRNAAEHARGLGRYTAHQTLFGDRDRDALVVARGVVRLCGAVIAVGGLPDVLAGLVERAAREQPDQEQPGTRRKRLSVVVVSLQQKRVNGVSGCAAGDGAGILHPSPVKGTVWFLISPFPGADPAQRCDHTTT